MVSLILTDSGSDLIRSTERQDCALAVARCPRSVRGFQPGLWCWGSCSGSYETGPGRVTSSLQAVSEDINGIPETLFSVCWWTTSCTIQSIERHIFGSRPKAWKHVVPQQCTGECFRILSPCQSAWRMRISKTCDNTYVTRTCMYVCMPVCMYVCMYVCCMHVRVCVCAYVCIHRRIHEQMNNCRGKLLIKLANGNIDCSMNPRA